MKKGFSPEGREINSKFAVEPSAGILGAENCVVIEDVEGLDIASIFSFARENGAFIDNSDDEAGDDECVVRFPGKSQKIMDYDKLAAELRQDSQDDE